MNKEIIRAIIVEDVKPIREKFVRVIEEKYKNKIDLLDAVDSVPAAIQAIEKHSPDLVFLDIHLGNQTAFDLLQSLEKIDFWIIFVTDHESYAYQVSQMLHDKIGFCTKRDIGTGILSSKVAVCEDYFKMKRGIENREKIFEKLHFLENLILNKPIHYLPFRTYNGGIDRIMIENIIRIEYDSKSQLTSVWYLREIREISKANDIPDEQVAEKTIPYRISQLSDILNNRGMGQFFTANQQEIIHKRFIRFPIKRVELGNNYTYHIKMQNMGRNKEKEVIKISYARRADFENFIELDS